MYKMNRGTLSGILFVVLFAITAIQISEVSIIKKFGISPLIVGILIGMVYASTLRGKLPDSWVPGIQFSAKRILRLAIILYGFRITFQQIVDIGVPGLIASITMLTGTLLFGILAGRKLLKLDRDTTLLVASGGAVCGAAAVLATEATLKSEPHKTAIAIATVVLFGTISMFLYPALYSAGLLDLAPNSYGIYVGAAVHEVAQVVVAGNVISGAGEPAVIVKMTRVMLLAPFLIILGLCLTRKSTGTHNKALSFMPWFALGFIAVSGINSMHIIPASIVSHILELDAFLLTMAMTALGMETNAKKFKAAGLKPILLAMIIFIWLLLGGYFVTKFAVSFA